MNRFLADINGANTEFFVETIDDGKLKLVIDEKTFELDVVKTGQHSYSVLYNNASYTVDILQTEQRCQVFFNGQDLQFNLLDDRALRRRSSGAGAFQLSGQIVSPMPGKVVDLKAKVGQRVKAGQGLVVVEAMKMQNEFKAAIDGVVCEVCVKVGDSVE